MALNEMPEKSVALFNHILIDHQIWNRRLLKLEHDFDVWRVHPIEDWEEIHYDNQRTTFEIITNTDDFEKRVDYKISEDRVFVNEIKDALFHIINHSAHHRGQIAMNFRDNGIEPIPLDYINYKR